MKSFLKKVTLGKITLVMLVLAFALFLMSAFYPIEPVEVKSITPNKDTYKVGENMTYTVDRCRNIGSGVTGTVYRLLVNNHNSELLPISLGTDTIGDSERGCGQVTKTVALPLNVPTGDYRLEIKTSINVFFLRPPVENAYFSTDIHIQGLK